MTSTVTEVTRVALHSHGYASLSRSVGLAAILLLVALLVLGEVLRALDGRWSLGRRALSIGTLPLFCAFLTILVSRFLIDILQWRG